MAKHKSPQELMAARNPLNRVAVAPVDIYNQPPEPVVQTAAPKDQPRSKNSSQDNNRADRPAAPKAKIQKEPQETDSPYSTYLSRRQVKGIKLRAIEQGVKDKQVVQAAVDEYFKNHPL